MHDKIIGLGLIDVRNYSVSRLLRQYLLVNNITTRSGESHPYATSQTLCRCIGETFMRVPSSSSHDQSLRLLPCCSRRRRHSHPIPSVEEVTISMVGEIHLHHRLRRRHTRHCRLQSSHHHLCPPRSFPTSPTDALCAPKDSISSNNVRRSRYLIRKFFI